MSDLTAAVDRLMKGQKRKPEIDELGDGSVDLIYRKDYRKLLINVKGERFTFSALYTDGSQDSIKGSGPTERGCQWLHWWLEDGPAPPITLRLAASEVRTAQLEAVVAAARYMLAEGPYLKAHVRLDDALAALDGPAQTPEEGETK